MKEKIAGYRDEKDVVCISYTDNAEKIVWEEEGKEFFYNNLLYDIVKTDTIDGKVFLYCVNDYNEHKVVSQNAETAKNNNVPGKKSGITKNELPVLFFAEDNSMSYYSSGTEQITAIYKSPLHDGNKENVSPPPKTDPA